MRRLRRGIGIAGVFAVTACASAATPSRHAAVAPAASAPPVSAPRTTASPKAPVIKRPPRPKVIVSYFRAADGTVVTAARFSGPVHYRLHSGSSDPGSAALSVVRAGPAVGSGERRRLLAAFNGGFLLSSHAGGYEQEGHIISPLRRGLASLVIDRSGTARIGVWGSGLPRPGESVFSVRQNLRPLVRGGHATGAAADWTAWGATLGGGEDVARSALGENAAGELIYAAGMSTTPADLAAALVHAGARTAMELDINPEWVQLDVARRPGRGLRAAIPGQVRPADQCLIGWTRDFIAVLAA
ncbi:MAG: hypothetical protein ACLQI7_06070 [Streptosporangiaceae bacterium]